MNFNFGKSRMAGLVVLLVAAAVSICPAMAKPSAKPEGKPAVKAKAQPTSIAASAATTKPASSTAKAPAARPQVAHFRINGALHDSPAAMSLLGETGTSKTLRDLLTRLAQARQDDNVAAVAVEFGSVQLNWSQAQELAQSLERLNEAKPVYAYMTSGGISQYIAASAGRDLAMEPAGNLTIVGMGAELMFFRGTLDLVGVEPQMVQIGKYKGAAEPFANTQPSEELVGEYNKLMDDLYEQLTSQIAAHRKLDVAQVKAAIDQGPFDGGDALKYKLVDQTLTRPQWQEYVDHKVARDGKTEWLDDYAQEKRKAIDMSNPFALLGALTKPPAGQEIVSPTVAIVYAEGVIVSGRSGEGLLGQKTIGAKTMIETFKQVADDDRIKAVVLRINSPGGSALASELINQAIQSCAKKKPVVVSVAGMAASGGYYMAVGAPTIYADSTAIVGSIGVITGKMAVTKLLDKVGISTYTITRGKNAGLDLSRPWTSQEMEVVRRLAQKTYDQFVERVGQSRGKKVANVADIAQGRIFTARQAVANGMIDKIGGLREAVDDARHAAKLEKSNLISLPKPQSLIEMLMSEDDDGDDDTLAPLKNVASGSALRNLADSKGAAYLVNLAHMLRTQATLAAMPYYLDVKP